MKIPILFSRATPFIIGLFFLVPTQFAFAQERSLSEVVDDLLMQIQELTQLVEQRASFGLVEATEVEESISQYFFLRQQGGLDGVVYGDVPTKLVIEGDGGVKQILIQQDCDRPDFIIRTSQSGSSCNDLLWLLADESGDGVVTFTSYLTYVGESETDTASFDVFACRFNGCSQDFVLEAEYKEKKVLTDYIDIKNRHAYEYEYDDETFYVQEILLNFAGQKVNGLRVISKCEDGAISSNPGERDRFSCSENTRISQTLVERDQVDEFGNVFDLKVDFVANVTDIDTLGSVEVEFRVVNERNQVFFTTHKVN